MTEYKELAALVVGRIGAEFDGEAHFTEDEARRLASAIEALEAERDEARLLVAEANNSLYGSQGYFHSLDGGPFNRYHLAGGIEKLKQTSNKHWHELQDAEARCKRLEEALRPFAEYMGDSGDLDNRGQPLPGDQGVGWIYLNHADFRRARLAVQENTNGG